MSKGKKKGDRTDLLTKEEMNKLLLTISMDLYFNTLYNILLHTGRRIGEIYGTPRGDKLTGGIKVKDIDFPGKQMTTVILKTKKRRLSVKCASCGTQMLYRKLKDQDVVFCSVCGTPLQEPNKEQFYYAVQDVKTIPLKEGSLMLLQMYIKKEKLGQSDYLFREKSLPYLKKAVKKHASQAGIVKNFTLHGFRHYFVTACKRAGMSNEDIAKWTGHLRPETLNTYNRMVPRDVEKRIMEVEL